MVYMRANRLNYGEPVYSPELYIGQDFGQRVDFSAFVGVEEAVDVDREWGWTDQNGNLISGWTWPSTLTRAQVETTKLSNIIEGRRPQPPLLVRFAERWPLDTSYSYVVEQSIHVMKNSPIRELDSTLVVDNSGVGLAVKNIYNQHGFFPSSIGSGQSGVETRFNAQRREWYAGKRELVMAAVVVSEQRWEDDPSRSKLEVAQGATYGRVLEEEIRGLRRKLSATGIDRYEAAPGVHDDLVMSMCYAIFLRQWSNMNIDITMARDMRNSRNPYAIKRW